MQIGIVGPKNSGKSTTFQALTGIDGGAEGSKTGLGVINVPDERIDRLSEIFKPRKTVYAEIKFVDVAGSSEPAENKKGIDAKTLSQIRLADALVVVIRAFENPAVIHPGQSIDPLRDFCQYEEELQTTDFIQIETRLDRLKKENKKGLEADVLQKCRSHLEGGLPLRLFSLAETEAKAVGGFRFLSQKPLLVLLNCSEGRCADHDTLHREAEKKGGQTLALSAKLEQEITQLPREEQADYLKEMGMDRPVRARFIQTAYSMMKLISFFTVGEDEVRAWTLREGTHALEAAGKIHSDLQRGFIRADVVHYEDFMKSPSMAKAREAGLLRQEGKGYCVKDGDIVEIKFNV